MKKLLFVTLTGLFLWLVNAQEMKNPDTLVAVTFGDWGSGFDPAYCYDSACGNVLDNTLEGLFAYDGASATELVPRLAVAVPTLENGGISADGLTYTVKLRSDINFSDGSPVTAEDVEYSIERMMVYSTDVGSAGILLEPLVGSAELIRVGGEIGYDAIDKSVETESTDTVIFTLAKPFAPFLGILAGYYGSVYSKADAISKGDWGGAADDWEQFNNAAEGSTGYATTGALGSGAFVIERYDVDQTVVLKRNDNYWREAAPLARVIIQSIPDDTTRVQLLQTGDADMAIRSAFPQALLPTLEEIPGIVIEQQPALSLTGFFMTHQIDGTGTNYLGSGTLDGNGIPADFFSDINVRKGFAYAFDYDSFIKDVLLNNGTQQNTITVQGLLGYTDSAPRYSYDPAKAEEFFKAAWDGQVWENGFSIPVFFNSGNTTRQQGLEIIKRGVEALNPKFKIEVRELQFSQILTQASANQLTMWMGGWGADFADPHSFAQPFLESNGTYAKHIAYSNPELDKLIAEAVIETDSDKRAVMYQQIAQLGFDETPEIPTHQPMDTHVQHTWVKGRVINPILSSDYFYLLSKSDTD
jgi:peptide/nickel transport system substrate-binding protein